MIAYFHDGPKSQAPYYFDPLIQYLVAEGYGVIAPNIRGSSGYGPGFELADNLTGREAALKDAAAITEWIRLSGFANPKKIVALGKGYGGYITLSMLSLYPDIWTAGVSIDGSPNLLNFVRSAKAYQKNEWAIEYGNPDKDTVFLQKISPLSHANTIKQPLMIVHSKANAHISAEDMDQLTNNARNNGAAIQYLRFDNESAEILTRENLIKTYSELVRFIDINVRSGK
ncbi:MAG: S9 family peptidase [Chlorobiales bacterium]|nr:S9 family peptidase [Chlorobiales bacterium]